MFGTFYALPAEVQIKIPANRIVILITNFTIALALAFACLNSAIAGVIVPLNVSHARAIALTSGPKTLASEFMPVSVQRVGDYIALADYGSIYCLDPAKGTLNRVDRPMISGHWVPTGIFWHLGKNKLYVANYQGNNVVEGHLDCNSRTFTVIAEISSSETISPENVVVSEDDSRLYCANYDGNSVTAFHRKDGTWVPQWTRKIRQAHGIGLGRDSVFVTSLFDHALYRLDAETGAILRVAGHYGIRGWQSEYMWPTSIAVTKDEIWVSDAHTGYVCRVDSETLESAACIGGYGGGPTQFHMPYGISVERKDATETVLVTSTFASRVTEIGIPGNSTESAFVLHDWYFSRLGVVNKDYLELKSDSASRRQPVYGDNPRSTKCEMPDWLPSFTCEYGTLVTAGRKKVLQFPGSKSVVQTQSQIYFIDSFKGQDSADAYFFSPESGAIYDMRAVEDVPYLLPMALNSVGNFAKEGRIVSPVFTTSFESLRLMGEKAFRELLRGRDANGVIDTNTAARILCNSGVNGSALLERLKVALHAYDEGDQFVDAYGRYKGSEGEARRLRDLAIRLLDRELRRKDIPLDGSIVPCMLVSAKCVGHFRTLRAQSSGILDRIHDWLDGWHALELSEFWAKSRIDIAGMK